MKLINQICSLLLAGLACGCASNNTANEESKINISATTGLISEATFDLKRITNAERKELGIDTILKGDNHYNYPNRDIAKGKEIYKGEEGRIASFLVIWVEQAIFEYLVSYDPSGNVIDHIMIGVDYYYSSDLLSASIEGNKIRSISEWADPGEAWGEGIDQIYTITDDLHFIPFAWTAQSFPVEIPFLTYKTEEPAFYYNIESVTCIGKSGNNYTFVIKGKSQQDFKPLKAAARTLMFEPYDKEGISVGEAIKVVIPAVRENETFEIKVKGLTKSKVDENSFTRFHIQR